jgi:hypothetical protein
VPLVLRSVIFVVVNCIFQGYDVGNILCLSKIFPRQTILYSENIENIKSFWNIEGKLLIRSIY